MRKNMDGFSLIEVLIALLIFSLGVISAVAFQARAFSYSVDAENRARAALLANEIISTMWTQKSNSPTSLESWMNRVKDPTVSGLPVPANAPPTVSTDAATGLTTITITWKAPSKLDKEANSQYVTSVDIR